MTTCTLYTGDHGMRTYYGLRELELQSKYRLEAEAEVSSLVRMPKRFL